MQHTNTVRPRPSRALPVRNLPISYAFYTDLLGFGTTATALPDHLAEVTDFDDDPLLLIGPQASDVTTYLNSPHTIMKPSSTLGFFCQDLDTQMARWSMRGLKEVEEATAVVRGIKPLPMERTGTIPGGAAAILPRTFSINTAPIYVLPS